MRRSILQGDLACIMLPDVLSFVGTLKKTGELVFRREGRSKTVFWGEGEIIFASSTDPEDSLGAFFVRNGIITQADNLRAMSQVTREQRQGKVLVQMGLLTPKELWWGVKQQVLEIIFSLFLWQDGEFEFVETDEAREETIPLNTTTTNIILEGVRRMDEWSRMKTHLPALDDVLDLMRGPEEAGVELDEKEQEVLRLVNGERTLYDIIAAGRFGEFEAKKRIVSLLTAGLVGVREKPGRPSAAPEDEMADDSEALNRVVQVYNDIFGIICGEVRRAGNGRAAQVQRSFEEFFESDPAVAGLFRGVALDAEGRLDANALLANIAELPASERSGTLDRSLNDLLSYELFSMSRYLGPKEKSALFKRVAEEKKRLKAG